MKKIIIILIGLLCLVGCGKSTSSDKFQKLEKLDNTFSVEVDPKTNSPYIQGRTTWNQNLIIDLESKLENNFRILAESVATKEDRPNNTYQIQFTIATKQNSKSVIPFLKAKATTQQKTDLFTTCEFKKQDTQYTVIVTSFVDKMSIDREPYKIKLTTL